MIIMVAIASQIEVYVVVDRVHLRWES